MIARGPVTFSEPEPQRRGFITKSVYKIFVCVRNMSHHDSSRIAYDFYQQDAGTQALKPKLERIAILLGRHFREYMTYLEHTNDVHRTDKIYHASRGFIYCESLCFNNAQELVNPTDFDRDLVDRGLILGKRMLERMKDAASERIADRTIAEMKGTRNKVGYEALQGFWQLMNWIYTNYDDAYNETVLDQKYDECMRTTRSAYNKTERPPTVFTPPADLTPPTDFLEQTKHTPDMMWATLARLTDIVKDISARRA